ncbi:hypothetical protein [Sinomonas humi]|uniref:Uncharacterized protein n=1 Tax=Sinomonas humi TaxID=1338436 RepID=A0A0B2AQG2_9MICC|nr:hypothetical protein [Sinomonas humi]KHL05674.1 hypothetical protein LK10_00015 [Sinomonas humi]
MSHSLRFPWGALSLLRGARYVRHAARSSRARRPLRPKYKAQPHLVRSTICFIVRLTIILFVLSLSATVPLNWLTPLPTAFMSQAGSDIIQQDVSLDHISCYVIAAAIVHKDAQFGSIMSP